MPPCGRPTAAVAGELRWTCGRRGSGRVAAQLGEQPWGAELAGEARGGAAQQVALGAGGVRVGEGGLGGRDVRAGAERRPQVQGAA